MGKFSIKPTDAELEILQVLWKEGPCTVRTVHGILASKKNVGYTTTLKLMQIMLEKGICLRNSDAKSHIYSPAFAEVDTKSNIIQDFVNAVYEGSAMKLVAQVLGDYKANKSEIAELKQIISDLENKHE